MSIYALIDIKGKQYKIREGEILLIDRIKNQPGQKLSFDRVLLAGRGEQTLIGDPFIKGAQVTATVKKDTKGRKVIVFKKKKRKDYKRTIGHRQLYTEVKIENIKVSGLEKKEASNGS